MFGKQNRTDEILEVILLDLKEILQYIRGAGRVVKFTIRQETKMSIQGIAQGGTGTFVATPLDQNGNPASLPAGVVPTWTSSDTTNTSLTPSADGLSVAVAVSPSAPVGSTFTLSCQATLPDGSTPNGNASVPYLAATLVVKSFQINQQ